VLASPPAFSQGVQQVDGGPADLGRAVLAVDLLAVRVLAESVLAVAGVLVPVREVVPFGVLLGVACLAGAVLLVQGSGPGLRPVGAMVAGLPGVVMDITDVAEFPSWVADVQHVPGVADRGEPTGTGAGGLGPVLLGEPSGLVVAGRHVTQLRVVGPVGPAVGVACVEGQADHPGAVLLAPGVPLGVRVVHLTLPQALLHHLAQGEGGHPRTWTAQPHAAGLGGDELALSQHGTFEPADVFDRGTGRLSDLLGGLTSPDPGLDLLRTQTLGLDLQLPEARAVATYGSPERFVDLHPELLSRVVGEDEMLAVIMYADEREVPHGLPLPPRPRLTLPSRLPDRKHVTGRGAGSSPNTPPLWPDLPSVTLFAVPGDVSPQDAIPKTRTPGDAASGDAFPGDVAP
jgi:hypothetical protein